MILSEDSVRARLLRKGDDRIVITPLIEAGLAPGTLDVRLARDFVVFRKTRYLGVDAISTLRSRASRRQATSPRTATGDQQALQELEIIVGRTVENIFVPFGDTFVLHPYQLVLACTLEYVGLPATVGAYVLSRSSIGRLGILSATATYIHPGYAGVITLELLNTGETPVSITPGMRIAQLVFETAEEGTRHPGRYHFSTRPEAAMLTRDDELQRLAFDVPAPE